VQTDKRQQLLVIVAIVAIGLFAGDRFVFSPLVQAWKARNLRITELKAQVEQGKTLLVREQAVRSGWESIRRNALPRNTSAAEQQLFKAIDQWAQESRVGIMAITPQWKQDAKDYMTLQCHVDLTGGISALSRFLYAVEKDPMAIKLDSVELSSRDKDGQTLALGLQLSGLVLTPEAK
jgi:Tfp pilus assembly protein PilO